MHRRTTVLAAALSLLPLGQPLLLGTFGITTATTAAILHAPVAVAQNASSVARIAKAITVRIEGATQGSGVIVKKEDNRYTVLTAWHVVSGNRPGEEVGIYTPDGKQHQLEQGSIQRLGQVDMAVLTFSSPGAYEVASVGDVKSVNSGNPIFVSGFPLPTSSVPASIWRFLDGKVIANATVAIRDGYQLLYSNQTLPGMSGGSVLNSQGQLVGIHGRSERDDQVSMSTGKEVSTGTNQAVPISYYRQFNTGQTVIAANTQATNADDYLAQAKQLEGQKGRDKEMLRVANQALTLEPSALGYAYRGYAKIGLNNYQGAIDDYNMAIQIQPKFASAYANRGQAKYYLDNHQGAISDITKALEINPQESTFYTNRAAVKEKLEDYQGAIADYNKAIELNPQDARFYYYRAYAKIDLNNYQGAIADYNKVIAINPQYTNAYYNRGNAKRELKNYQGAIADYNKALTIDARNSFAYNNRGMVKGLVFRDREGACADFKKAASLGLKSRTNWLNSESGAWCRNMQ